MSDNLFSIIIPTRQRHDTLKYTIHSVINQTYKEFELIVMDNFSSPETAEVVASFADRRIKYYRAPQRLSMSDNWEMGLSHATGEYMFILGDDDALMPDGLELAEKLISEYAVDILSWQRYSYGWPNAIVPWVRNRLYLSLLQVAEFWNSREKLKQFYNYQLSHEYLPMIYNSFVHKNLIEKIKSIHGRYFMSSNMAIGADVYSGIVNAYFSDNYLYSFRSISIIGSSGNSIGASVCYPGFNAEPMKAFLEEEKKSFALESHPILVPTKNQEIGFADGQIRTQELFFPDDSELDIDIHKLLNFIVSSMNRDPSQYESILQDIEALANKHNISVSTLNIPQKVTTEQLNSIQPYQGVIVNTDGSLNELIINCEQVGISNVAEAVKLAHGILPKLENIIIYNVNFYKDKLQNKLNTNNQKNELLTPKILIDGIFFQLFNTGIARVWKSLLKEWANTDFANHILVLDRANTAPIINGIRYRTIDLYDYNNTESDRALLQKICDEEGADLFISTYYTTPIDTPSVFMAYDMIPEVMGANFNEPMWREKHQGINHASAFIAISQNTAKDINKFFPDIPLESMTVAYCGVDPLFSPAYESEINDFKYKYGINKPYFLLSGLGGYKNAILFFQAFAQLSNKQSFDIVATGAGILLPSEWRQYTAGCTFHGFQLNDEELRLAYAGAVALVYPSQYEGFGMPVAEAMACGCPVITTPNASLPEVGGEAVIYVKDDDIQSMADALCQVQKPFIRNSLIQAGLVQARKFSWSKMSEIVSNVLINQTLETFNIREINLIMFPDWNQSEEDLYVQIGEVIKALATDFNAHKTTLLIYVSNTDPEGANLILSGIAMNLMMEDEIDITERMHISLMVETTENQWKNLLPHLHSKVVLERENQQAIAKLQAEKLPVLAIAI